MPLGVLLRNENILDEMIDILESLQKYVPVKRTTENFYVDGEGEISLEIDHFSHVLNGGDQLSNARVRGSQGIRANSSTGSDRLEGFVPVIEDWHAKVILLKSVWARLYKTSSSSDCGTLYQLRNVINRRNVVSRPENDVNSCEEFFILIVKAYTIVAAMNVFGMSEITDFPVEEIFPTLTKEEEKSSIIESAASVIVEEYVKLSYPTCLPKKPDHIKEYAKDVLTMGLFYMEFQDAIREGDGKRVLICWKFLMLIYRATGHVNYAKEALTLLCQYHYLFPKRLAEQLIWSRFINTQGQPGTNIPADLHMEHLNRLCKESLSNLGANKTPKAIQRIGRALGPLQQFLQNFDITTKVEKGGSSHTIRSESADLKIIVNELKKQDVFNNSPGRKYQSFPKHTCNCYKGINKRKLKKWMQKHFSAFLQSSHLNIKL